MVVTRSEAPWIPEGYAAAARRVRGTLMYDWDEGRFTFVFDKPIYDEKRQAYYTRVEYNSILRVLEDFDESAVKRALREGSARARKRVAFYTLHRG